MPPISMATVPAPWAGAARCVMKFFRRSTYVTAAPLPANALRLLFGPPKEAALALVAGLVRFVMSEMPAGAVLLLVDVAVLLGPPFVTAALA